MTPNPAEMPTPLEAALERLRLLETELAELRQFVSCGRIREDAGTGRLDCSAELSTLLGLEGATISTITELFDRICPSDRTRLVAAWIAAHDEEQNVSVSGIGAMPSRFRIRVGPDRGRPGSGGRIALIWREPDGGNPPPDHKLAGSRAVAAAPEGIDRFEQERLPLLAVNQIPAAIGYWNLNQRNLFANEACRNWFRAEPEALRGRHLRDVFGDERYLFNLPCIEAALRGEARQIECALSIGPQPLRYALVQYLPDSDRGRVRGFFTLITDVTSQHESDRRLFESESLFRHVFEQSPTGVAVYRDDGQCVMANRGLATIIGGERSAVQAQNFRELTSWRESSLLDRAIAVLETGEPHRCELNILTTFGRPVVVDFCLQVLYRNQQRHLLLIAYDVTEQRQFQRRLENQIALLNAVIESSSDLVFMKDLEGKYRLINSTLAQTLGKPPDEILGMDDPALFPPEIAARLGADDQAVIQQRRALDFDDDLVLDGVMQHYWVKKNVCFDWRGEVIGLVGIARNVTEQRQAEQALRHNEALLGLAQQAAGIGVWEWLPATGQALWTAELEALYGRPSGTQHSYQEWTRQVHPDDLAKVCEQRDQAITAGTAFDTTYRIVRPDGQILWINTRGRALHAADGGIERVIGVDIDVTERVRFEQLLLASEERFRSVFECAPVPIWKVDLSAVKAEIDRLALPAADLYAHLIGRRDLLRHLATCVRVLDINPAGLRFLGVHSKEKIDSLFLSFLDEPSLDEFASQLASMARGERHWTGKDGPFRTFHGLRIITAEHTVVPGHEEDWSKLFVSTLDITDRKRAELDRLKDLEQQRDLLILEVHHRVKNHLQGLTGLLREHVVRCPDSAEPLEDAIRQIDVIAQLYGLQGTYGNAPVSVGDLVELGRQAQAAAAAIDCLIAEPTPKVPAEEAVPMALTVNELIANAVKHTPRFPSIQGTVKVEVSQHDGATRIRIENRPAALPDGFDLAAGAGVKTGLELVRSLLPCRHVELTIQPDGDGVVAELLLAEAFFELALTPVYSGLEPAG